MCFYLFIFGASISIHLAVLPSELSASTCLLPAMSLTEGVFGQVTGRFLNLETKGLGFTLVPEATFSSTAAVWGGTHFSGKGDSLPVGVARGILSWC